MPVTPCVVDKISGRNVWNGRSEEASAFVCEIATTHYNKKRQERPPKQIWYSMLENNTELPTLLAVLRKETSNSLLHLASA